MSIKSLKIEISVVEKYLRTAKSQVESLRFLIYCHFLIASYSVFVVQVICQYVIAQRRIIINQSCAVAFLKTSYNLGKKQC